MKQITLLAAFASALAASAQAINPLIIPPALDQDTFDLDLAQHVHSFYPGISTTTFGVSGDYLGPTLILHKGDTTHINVHNDLPEITSVHWHGLIVPGEMDGGPPRIVQPGDVWNVKYKVKNLASTYWYHPHPHEMTAEQATMGIAGMIIVRDAAEAALTLPRTYGIDDFPVIVQDRRFAPDGNFVFGAFGDSLLVNGTAHPYLDVPAQVVRLRLLNGSNSRIYKFGFDDGRTFSVIGEDDGLLSAPATTDRLLLANGERAEILLDLTGMQGDSLQLMSFNSELTVSMPGGANMMWEASALNGIDFPALRLRVTPPTGSPVTTIPTTLIAPDPPNISDVSRTRYKSLSGTGMVGMGTYYINGLQFDMNVINDTVMLGATEIWDVLNASDIAHPFHIHGVSFYILDRNSALPNPWEMGPKDVVMLDMADHVRLLVKFDSYVSNGWPFMYHCHNLMHEDNMMMAQYIVVDPNAAVPHLPALSEVAVFPSPTSSETNYQVPFIANDLLLMDRLGRIVLQRSGMSSATGTIDMQTLPAGPYLLVLRSRTQEAHVLVVRE